MNEPIKSHEEVCEQSRRGLSAAPLHRSFIFPSLSAEPPVQAEGADRCVESGECSSSEEQPKGRPPCDVFEELYCPRLPSAGLVPLAFRTHPGPHSDVLRRGYLGKQEHKRRKYVVLRAGSHTGPSRLEWYKTEESFSAVEKSAKETGLFCRHKRGVIFLRCCLGVSLISGPRKEHKVALYTKDQSVVFMGKDQQEQHEWYTAIKELMEEEQKDGHGEGFDEEDAGYCTLPPASFYKQVWPVTVKLCGLGRSKALAGEVLLCLTASALVLVRVGHDLHLPSVTLPLLAVRRFGHLDGSFFLELGRSAPHGPGEIWMEPRDEGNSSRAQQIHEVVRDVVKALRVIPDFNWSISPSKSSSSHHQGPPALKRSRPKQRDKTTNCRVNASPPLLNESQNDCTKVTDKVNLSPLEPEPHSYMEMNVEHTPVRERRAEGPGYMLMSPQTSLHHDEYVNMTSPNSSFSFLQSSFSSSVSDVPVREQTPPPWTLFSGQQSNPRTVSAWATSSPIGRSGGLRPGSLFSPVRPETDTSSERSATNCLRSCLPSCFQPKKKKIKP